MTLGPNSSHHFPLGSLMMLMAQFPLGLCLLWPVSIKSLPNLTPKKKKKSQGIVVPKNSQPCDWIIWSMWHLSTTTVNQVPVSKKFKTKLFAAFRVWQRFVPRNVWFQPWSFICQIGFSIPNLTTLSYSQTSL